MKTTTLLQYHYLGGSCSEGSFDRRKRRLNFFMKSDAYIPSKMAFRNISVNSKGKAISPITMPISPIKGRNRDENERREALKDERYEQGKRSDSSINYRRSYRKSILCSMLRSFKAFWRRKVREGRESKGNRLVSEGSHQRH